MIIMQRHGSLLTEHETHTRAHTESTLRQTIGLELFKKFSFKLDGVFEPNITHAHTHTHKVILTLEWMIITFSKYYSCIYCFLVRNAYAMSTPHSGITHHCSLNCLFMFPRRIFSPNKVELLLIVIIIICVARIFNEARYRMFCTTHVPLPCIAFVCSHWNCIWRSHIEWEKKEWVLQRIRHRRTHSLNMLFLSRAPLCSIFIPLCEVTQHDTMTKNIESRNYMRAYCVICMENIP